MIDLVFGLPRHPATITHVYTLKEQTPTVSESKRMQQKTSFLRVEPSGCLTELQIRREKKNRRESKFLQYG